MTNVYGFNYDQKINKQLSTTPNGVLYANIDNPTSTFGDLRVAELTPKAQLTFPYNYINTDIVTTGESNGGSSFTADSMIGICTGLATAGAAYFESREVVKYQAGMGGMTRFTCIFTDGVADSEQLVGVGDDEDGFFFGYNGGTFGTMRLDNSISTWAAQSDWNLDTFDGSGSGNPSGITLDTSKINVYQIAYQWLGGGKIQYSIENPTTGLLTPVNQIAYANSNTTPSIRNPNLPLTGRVRNLGNNSSVEIKVPCMGGFVEGKSVISGPTFNYGKSLDNTTSFFHLKNETEFKGIKNRVRTYLRILSVSNESNTQTDTATIAIYKNLNFASAPSWSDISDNSVMKYNAITVPTIDSGKIIYRIVIPHTSGKTVNLDTLNLFMIPGDTITVYMTGSGNNVPTYLTWMEDF